MFIPNTKPIPREDEIALFELAKNGDKKAADRLILSNYRFVIAVSRQYLHRGVEAEDLVSEGVIGLHRALETFNPAKGFRFISYAVWWIRRYMVGAIHEQGLTVRLPSNFHINNKAKKTGRHAEHVEAIRRIRSSPSLEALTASGHEIIHDGPSPDDAISKEINAELVATLLEGLEPIDQMIIRKSFGIDSGEPENLAAIGNQFNLSRERIRQRHMKAISKLGRTVNRMNSESKNSITL